MPTSGSKLTPKQLMSSAPNEAPSDDTPIEISSEQRRVRLIWSQADRQGHKPGDALEGWLGPGPTPGTMRLIHGDGLVTVSRIDSVRVTSLYAQPMPALVQEMWATLAVSQQRKNVAKKQSKGASGRGHHFQRTNQRGQCQLHAIRACIGQRPLSIRDYQLLCDQFDRLSGMSLGTSPGLFYVGVENKNIISFIVEKFGFASRIFQIGERPVYGPQDIGVFEFCVDHVWYCQKLDGQGNRWLKIDDRTKNQIVPMPLSCDVGHIVIWAGGEVGEPDIG